MSDTISVIVPVFNRAALLRRTLHSLIAQTRPASELIVVDDGSTEDIRSVVDGIPQARYIRQENGGLSVARNTGIRAASGEYIAFCDSDDLWEPDKLDWQWHTLRQTSAAWCAIGCVLIDPDDRVLPASDDPTGFMDVFPVFREAGVLPDAYFRRTLTEGHIRLWRSTSTAYVGDAYEMLFGGNVILPSSVLMHRSLVDRVGMFDPTWRAVEETEYFHRVAAAAPVALLMEPLVRYRVGHPSIIQNTTHAHLTALALDSGVRALALRQPTRRATRAFRRGRTSLTYRMAMQYVSDGDRVAARRALASLGVRGFDPRRATTWLTWSPWAPVETLRHLKRLAARR